MSKQIFVADQYVILSLQGLRWIKKEDATGGHWEGERYWLEYEYKGAKGDIKYKEKEERDAMYLKVSIALGLEVSK